MRGEVPAERRKGVATTEFTVILVAIAVIMVSVVVNVGGSVQSLWAAAANDGGLSDLSSAIEDMNDEPPCPFEYSPETGRWHDPANDYAFISFEDASAANCG